ncbi:molybdenum cofactor guanylyltransferase MobA [Xenophilus arseniciresistens]|uniref:Molybdenum cofactor guanylyltransferase n=1 Tax=Xenophilus arseniciresistens TaxID=1283306 RepID=A0AAE3N921_9BURK|nr:molybdenum cofactor guanylyltransferase MobA [Xenophilus arseniciresistens]MDA7416561.1 molybdenum cofactor guanylyltransferase MobA [Xenophilus arseniciresistens]
MPAPPPETPLPPEAIAREHITGLVLAGGEGRRMGGVDKGLQLHRGRPLALHALRRLQPQVGPALLSANRHLAAYEAMGVPVWPDVIDGHAGPLAGLLTGLTHARTAWLVTVPCDTPNFPQDLVPRLAAAALQQGADIAMAATREGAQPVFCLLRTGLIGSLRAFLQSGERKFGAWTARHACVQVLFDDAQAFFNANTTEELAQLQQQPPPAAVG